MKRDQQVLSPRERDLNTPGNLIKAVFVSVAGHIGLLVMVLLVSVMTRKPNLVVPGYKVNLVSVTKLRPSTLQQSQKKLEEPKPQPKKKKTVAKKKVATKTTVKKKIASKARKIAVAKKKTPKKEKKVEAPMKSVVESEEHKPVAKQKPPEKKQSSEALTGGVEFPYMWYLRIVERKIIENWVTHGMDITGWKRDPTVRFELEKDGSLVGASLENSSGSAALDKSVLDAVMAAKPFPELPEEYKKGTLPIYFTFSYEQRNEQ